MVQNEMNLSVKKSSQKVDIIDHLQNHGSLTRIEAIHKLGIIELPARIVELTREGFIIPRETYTGTAKNGRRYASTRYFRPTVWP